MLILNIRGVCISTQRCFTGSCVHRPHSGLLRILRYWQCHEDDAAAEAQLNSSRPPFSGVVHADLKLFLETNLSRSGKKKAVLGVSDAKIGAALQEEFSISIQTGGVVAEITRGKRNTAGVTCI